MTGRGWAVLVTGAALVSACGTGGGGAVSDNGLSSGSASAADGGTGVAGVVRDSAGAAVPGATMERASLSDPQRPLPALAAVSGLDGRYAWALPAGTWQLTVSAPGLRTTLVRVDVRQDAMAAVDVVLPPA